MCFWIFLDLLNYAITTRGKIEQSQQSYSEKNSRKKRESDLKDPKKKILVQSVHKICVETKTSIADLALISLKNSSHKTCRRLIGQILTSSVNGLCGVTSKIQVRHEKKGIPNLPDRRSTTLMRPSTQPFLYRTKGGGQSKARKILNEQNPLRATRDSL